MSKPLPPIRQERIYSLLDPKGEMSHSRRFDWKMDAPLSEKLIRLSVQVGRQIIDGAPADLERRLTDAVWNEDLDLVHGRAEPDLYTFSERLPQYLSHLHPVGQAMAVVHKGGDHPMDVILTPNLRPSSMTAIRANVDTLRLGVEGVYFSTPYWSAKEKWAMPMTQQIDPALLLGYPMVRQDILENTGIDLEHPVLPPKDDIEIPYGLGVRVSHSWLAVGDVSERLGERLDLLALDELGANRQDARSSELSRGRIATAFTDKVPVSVKVAAAARESPLRERFNHVEFDEDIDLAKTDQMAREITTALAMLPTASQALDTFRVRKLGKYAGYTKGVYSPDYRSLVIDDGKATRNGFSGLSSFVHEYAHHLDSYPAANPQPDDPGYTGRVSGSSAFRGILLDYCRDLPNLLSERNISVNRSRLDYLMTPSEVFARGFELWASESKRVNSSCIDLPNAYRTDPAYTSFEDVKTDLFAFFDRTYPDFQGFDSLTDTDKQSRTQPERGDSDGSIPQGAEANSVPVGSPSRVPEPSAQSRPVRRLSLGEARFRFRLNDGSFLSDADVHACLSSGVRAIRRVHPATSDPVGGETPAGRASSLSDAGRVLAVLANSKGSVRKFLPVSVMCVQTGRKVPDSMILPYLVDTQRSFHNLVQQATPSISELTDRFAAEPVSIMPDLDPMGAAR